MKLTFIGTGYVGLVSGVMMSYLGHQVTCIDVDENKINQLNNGLIPIYEPNLETYINICKNRNALSFQHNYENLSDQDAFFITVGTPTTPSGRANLSGVYKAIDSILQVANDQALIIIKSTVPPGSSLAIQEYIYSKGSDIKLANNPEFLREGSAVVDFLIPDRVVIGISNPSSANKIKDMYRVMINGQSASLLDLDANDDRVYKANHEIITDLTQYRKKNNLSPTPDFVVTDLTTSEMIKYASNSFLATKIAFINEMSDLCENTGANIKDLSFAVGLDRRIGSCFLKAGPGFGGSCFPKDIVALQNIYREKNTDSLILDAVIKANKSRPTKMVRKIKNLLGHLDGKQIAILGLTYKAGTDDFRNSPALEIIDILKKEGAKVRVFDPMGSKIIDYVDNLRKIPNIAGHEIHIESYQSERIVDLEEICDDAYEACSKANAAVFLTEWVQFEKLDFIEIKKSLKDPLIIDLRLFLDADKVKKAGLNYHTIGS